MAAPALTQDAAAVEGIGTAPSIGAATTSTSGAPIYLVLSSTSRMRDGTEVTGVPTGFTLWKEQFASEAFSSAPTILVYKKTSTGSESGSYTFTLSTSEAFTIGCFWASGSDESDPTPASLVAGDDSANDDTQTSAVAPSITTARDDTRVVRIFIHGGVTQNMGLSGITALWNTDVYGAAGEETQASAGATGTNTATLSAERWAAVTLGIQPPEAPDPATLSREPADIAAQEQTDTEVHVRVDSLDATAGNSTDLWISTTNHGEDAAATWEANATEFATAVSANDLASETGLSPNTTYYIAAITTDGSSNKAQSSVLTITTAYAKPTSPSIVSKTADTVTVSWTDASSGVADHQVFVRESSAALSTLEFKGTIPAGETLQFEFTDLTDGTEYSFEAVAWDGVETSAARYSALTAVTATPGASVPIMAYHYRQMAAA